MTDKLKCPFCHKQLVKDPDGYYTCYTDNCAVMRAGGNGASGSLSLWVKVIQMHNALEEIIAHPHGAACRNYARAKEALKIEFDGNWKDSLMKCGEKK